MNRNSFSRLKGENENVSINQYAKVWLGCYFFAIDADAASIRAIEFMSLVLVICQLVTKHHQN